MVSDATEIDIKTAGEFARENYLSVHHGVGSWLLTKDHKRIGLLYLFTILIFFLIASVAAALMRIELVTPQPKLVTSETYNKLFTIHGVLMVWFFLIPSIPTVLGNFILPMMIGARDVAFPKLNLLSWYIFVAGGALALWSLLRGAVDTGWAVYIMILPGMGVISELITCFSRKPIYGYAWVGSASMAIAVLGFLVWGHHMFVSSQSVYAGMVFSILSFLVAVPSGIKVFNWTATLRKGSIHFATPMLYALGFIGLFTIGGLTGLFLAALAVDVHVHDTYFVIAHFHYIMVGGMVMAFMGGLHYWWPKISGRLYPEFAGKLAAMITFIGFNLTFFPQFILGYLGQPRRYHVYPPEFQIYHVLSTAGASILGVGYLMPLIYFIWAWKHGRVAGPNPWRATGLEWQTPSPPPEHNFEQTPVVRGPPYSYSAEKDVDLDLASI